MVPLLSYFLYQCYPFLLLEGQHPAEFCSNQLKHTSMEVSSKSEDLDQQHITISNQACFFKTYFFKVTA